MCIWVHPTNHSLSTIIASDKSANKIFVYNMAGNVIQTINVPGMPGNIDIRYNFLLSGVLTDIVGYNDRTNGTIVFYKVNKTTRQLSLISSFSDGGMTGGNYGFCLYHSPVSGKYYAIASSSSTQMKQWELIDNGNGTIGGIFKRTWNNGTGDITEGLVADDEPGVLFAANEAEGIYKYNAEPDDPNPVGTLVAPTGVNGLTSNVEGITIYYSSQGNGYLIASSQGSNNFKIYERQAPHNFIKTVQVTDVGSTDGIDVINLNLGSSFQLGMFLVHDGTGSPFAIKACKWEDLLLDVDTAYWNPRHSPFSYTTNTFAVIGDFGSEGINEERVADLVKSWNPEYVITTGDNTYGSTSIDDNIGQYYSKFIYPYNGNYPPSSPDQNRFWVSVGNHDYDDGDGINAMKDYFPYLVPNTYYDIVIGDVHFFFLDSEQFYQYSGAQKIWFDNAVANSTARWRIAVFHRPPYTSGGGGHIANEHNMRAWSFNSNNFQLVFNGHVHNMEHLTVPGEQTNYCVQGAGGRSLYTFENNPSPATRVWGLDNKYGACKLIVSSTNLTIEFWSTNGITNILEHSFTLDNPIISTFQLSVNIENGWNMVSVPGINPAGMGVTTWWPNLTGTVWGFNGTVYVAKSTTTPGEGYWMKNIGAETYNYPAIQIVVHNPINAFSGWNMIGGYENNATVANLTTNPPNQITGTIWGFNGVQYVAATTLVPGYSYWVKLLPGCPCTITIPEALAQGNEVAEIFKDDWGKIIITDGAGRSMTLYSANGNINLDNYELPPAPPAGLFDIRYESGRIAENIYSSIHSVLMNGVEYPVKIKVENMDIKLMDESGKRINVNLKSGEDIIISDTKINKLMVSGEPVPTKYALEQNYPNPFNPSTRINYSIQKKGFVQLKVYDVLGKQVATLVDGEQDAGKYEVEFSVKGGSASAGNVISLASGIYFYRLTSGNVSQTKKMILVK